MRRILIMIVLAAFAPSMAKATPLYEVHGLINAPNPAVLYAGGVTETLSPCGTNLDPQVPPGTLQGVDGFWFTLPTTARGRAITVKPDPVNVATTQSSGQIVAYFYDSGCNLIKPPGSDGSGPKDANAYSLTTSDPVPSIDTDQVNEVAAAHPGDVFPTLHGTVPATATYIIVDLYAGGDMTFTLTVN